MNLFGFNLRLSRTAPVQKSLAASPDAWLRDADLDHSGPVLANAYQQVVWVYRAINVLAEQVANVPFLFSSGERGREELLASRPLLDFYNRPHPQLNRYQYWELRVIWLMLRGECFRVPIYDERPGQARRLRQVLLLDPARFQHIVEDHQLLGWRYTGFGPQAPLASQVFLPEEVWFEKLPNPFDFWRGFPPLYVAEMAARTDFAAGAFMRGLIENNADTGVIVRSNEWLSDEQREQILAALRDRKRRAGQADRPVLLLGSAEVVQPRLSSTDLQFLENRKFSRGEICAAFGVPEEIVTTTDTAKYDVMAGARLNFIENRVAPLCSRLEAEEDVTVKSIEPAASGWFDLDSLPIMQEARRSRLASARAGFEMGIPFNELNRVLDLGFKPLPWGDRGYVGSKLREVGAGSEPPRSGGSADRRNLLGSAASATHLDNGGTLPSAATGGTDPLARAAELLSSTPATPPNAPLVRRLRRFLFEQRGRVLAKLAAAPDSALPLLELEFENAQLLAAVAPLLRAAGRLAQAESGAPPSSEADLAAYLHTREPALAQVNRDTLGALEQTLAEGRAAQESPAQLAARIKAVFNQAAAQRAPVIATLELTSILTSQPCLKNVAQASAPASSGGVPPPYLKGTRRAGA